MTPATRQRWRYECDSRWTFLQAATIGLPRKKQVMYRPVLQGKEDTFASKGHPVTSDKSGAAAPTSPSEPGPGIPFDLRASHRSCCRRCRFGGVHGVLSDAAVLVCDAGLTVHHSGRKGARSEEHTSELQ